MKPIYLDYNATTPVALEVLDEMLPYLRDHFGNPSSSHPYGRTSRVGVDTARERLANLLGCTEDEVIFTGGGSESNNQAIKGVTETLRERGHHIITSAVEHPAVIAPCRWLEQQGYEVTYLPVDDTCRVSPDSVLESLRPETVLVTIMHANNEVGTIQPIAEIASIAHERGVPVHTDAAQSVGKISTRVDELGVDFLSVAGHKLYAPKGVGALYIRSGFDLPSFIHGAGHESGHRAGTENVASIAGLGRAAQLWEELISEYTDEIRPLRDEFFSKLLKTVGGIHLNGHPEYRLPNTLNVSFDGVDSHQLLESIPGIAASTGSACHAGTHEPSSVLTAMGISAELAIGALRLSLGIGTTREEIDQAVIWITEAVKKQR